MSKPGSLREFECSGRRNTSTTPPANRAPATTAGYPLKTPSWTAKEPRRELRREEALHRLAARHLVLAKKMNCSIFVARKSRLTTSWLPYRGNVGNFIYISCVHAAFVIKQMFTSEIHLSRLA